MKFLHINDSKSDIELFNKYIEDGKHVFVLIFMAGCRPCGETIPKWKHIETVLKKQYADNNNIVVADINKDMASFIKHVGEVIEFPTMKYIGNKGAIVEAYEKSNIPIKDRSTDSFIEWIESKINNVVLSKNNSMKGGLILGGSSRKGLRGGLILGGGASRKGLRGGLILGGASRKRRGGGVILGGASRKRRGGGLILGGKKLRGGLILGGRAKSRKSRRHNK